MFCCSTAKYVLLMSIILLFISVCMNFFILRYADGINRRLIKLTHAFNRSFNRWRVGPIESIQPLLTPENAWFYSDSPILIAHSGGGINGCTYTNSKEAIVQAITNGFRVIEVDVCMTSDGIPVLSHDFKPDFENLFEQIPTLKMFLSTPMDSGLTSLTFEDFLDLVKQWEGTILLDVRHTFAGKAFDHYDALLTWLKDHPLPKLNCKILFQVGSPKIAERFFEYGFNGQDLHCNFAFETLDLQIQWMVNHQLQTISIADCYFAKGNFNIFNLLKKANIKYFVYTVNHRSRMRYLETFGVSGVFTDRLKPVDSTH